MTRFIPTVLVQDKAAFHQRLAELWPLLSDPAVPMLQFDILDGRFLPDSLPTFPTPTFIAALPGSFPFEVHLMVANPLEQMAAWMQAGAKRIFFHAEAVEDLSIAVAEARSFGKADIGIALNPETDLAVLTPVAKNIDAVLLLGVHPGASGRPFLPETVERVSRLKALFPGILVEVDGGIRPGVAAQLVQAGADDLAVGSYFAGDAALEQLALLKTDV